MKLYASYLIKPFITQGFVIVDLARLGDSAEIDAFIESLKQYRNSMRRFFQLPDDEKFRSEVDVDPDPDALCHKAGYWPRHSFIDPVTKAGSCNEFYNSRNFFEFDDTNIMFASDECDTSIGVNRSLPNREAFGLSRYLVNRVTDPFLSAYCEYLGLTRPDYTFQLQCSYYPENSDLDMHVDSGFFEGIAGPAEGLRFTANDTEQETMLDLKSGEIILYTGKHFFKYYTALVPVHLVPQPLVHGVTATRGRMSVPFVCLNYRTPESNRSH